MSIRKICKELEEVARKEINEDPKRIQGDLAYLKEWISQQPHLNARTDDQLLIAFLRGTKFSLERTKEKLDMHYTLKTITPEIYKNRDPFDKDIQKILSLGIMLPLPNLPNPGDPRYMFARQALIEKHHLDQTLVFKVGTMLQDIMLLEDDNLAISGIIMMQDMGDITMGLLKSLPLSLVKKAMTCFQFGYPHRIKGMNVFNVSKVFDAMFTLFKPFLTEKNKKRIRIHSSLADMKKVIPINIIPEEYGGTGGKLSDIAALWKARVESYRDWFVEEEKYGTDESKRPGKPKTSESVFGLEGSFRQLAVD